MCPGGYCSQMLLIVVQSRRVRNRMLTFSIRQER